MAKRNDFNINFRWNRNRGKGGVVDYRFLASTTGSSISISVTYILFLTEMQKRQTPQNGFAQMNPCRRPLWTFCPLCDFEYWLGNNVGTVNKVDCKMSEHNGRLGPRSQVCHHENCADSWRDNYDVQAEAPVDETESNWRNQDYSKRVLCVLANECVHETPENEFFKYPHH